MSRGGYRKERDQFKLKKESLFIGLSLFTSLVGNSIRWVTRLEELKHSTPLHTGYHSDIKTCRGVEILTGFMKIIKTKNRILTP